jgi:hypothetical protein
MGSDHNLTVERDIGIRNIVLIFALASFLPASLSMLDHFTRSESAFNDYTEICGNVIDFRRVSSKGTFHGWELIISSGGDLYEYQSKRESFYLPMKGAHLVKDQYICIRELNGLFLMESFIIRVWTEQKIIITPSSARVEYFSKLTLSDFWMLLTSFFFIIIYFFISYKRRFL